MEHPDFDKMSYLELTAFQARVENSIRDRRIRCVLKTLAEKLSRAERIPSNVGFFEGMLARELKSAAQF